MGDKLALQLFVTSRTPLSERAETNIRQICKDVLGESYTLEVFDVVSHPDRAAEQQIVATPTLIVSAEGAARRLIGDFSDRAKVLQGLGLPPEESAS